MGGGLHSRNYLTRAMIAKILIACLLVGAIQASPHGLGDEDDKNVSGEDSTHGNKRSVDEEVQVSGEDTGASSHGNKRRRSTGEDENKEDTGASPHGNRRSAGEDAGEDEKEDTGASSHGNKRRRSAGEDEKMQASDEDTGASSHGNKRRSAGEE